MDELDEHGPAPKSRCLHRFVFTPVVAFLLTVIVAATCVVYIFLRVDTSSYHCSNSTGLGTPFFIFGDSYADVGNLPFGPSRRLPYGMTWPGHPAGRFSNGRVQSDFLAARVLGFPSPPAYAESNITTVPQGVNFAVGGSALTDGLGLPPIGTQVGWLENLVASGLYTQDMLAASVTFLCASGNDYRAYSGSLDFKNFEQFIEVVVELIGQSLRRLHALGLRNIMVTTVAPLNCLGATTYLTNYTSCDSNTTVDEVIYTHNSLLESTMESLSNELPYINFVLLRQDEALKHIQNNASFFNISQPFEPCCLGDCGAVDHRGTPLYTLCSDPGSRVLWDVVHPTENGWERVVNLYLNDPSFTKFASTLQEWSQQVLSSNAAAAAGLQPGRHLQDNSPNEWNLSFWLRNPVTSVMIAVRALRTNQAVKPS